MLDVGQLVPAFALPTDTGHFSLADYSGKNVVLFFFPKADTSGCTKEAIAFSELQTEFDAANTIVIGVSKDTPQKQAKFREKHQLTCLLGADHETDICETFGVWVEKSMYGKRYMGIQRAKKPRQRAISLPRGKTPRLRLATRPPPDQPNRAS